MDYEDLLREKEKGKRRVKKRRSDDDMISVESIYDNESIRKVRLDHFTIIRIIMHLYLERQLYPLQLLWFNLNNLWRGCACLGFNESSAILNYVIALCCSGRCMICSMLALDFVQYRNVCN